MYDLKIACEEGPKHSAIIIFELPKTLLDRAAIFHLFIDKIVNINQNPFCVCVCGGGGLEGKGYLSTKNQK
jgi:hypothetical protein